MKMQRTSRALSETVFEELEQLRNGGSTPQKARAVSSLANTICLITRLEMDYARFVSKERSDEGNESLKALPMGQAPKK